jgi:hypothetical protein
MTSARPGRRARASIHAHSARQRGGGGIADFAESCADVSDRDYAAYVAAIQAGTVSVPAG